MIKKRYYNKLMDEVSSLPKLTNDQHSSTAGHLANYHNSISEQLMRNIGHLQKVVKSISDETTQKLTEKMNDYKKNYDQANTESREIIDSMSSKSFEELRNQLKSIGENLLNNFNSLKKDCIDTYSQSFMNIKPLVDQTYENCKDILLQVPTNISERLKSEVTRINSNFLKSKQDLTKILYQIEINTRTSIQNYENEFEQREDKWKENRFNSLVEQAKTQLDFTKFIDFGDLYNQFYTEQGNFTLCFRKTLLNLIFLLPPDHFNNELYEEWVKEVDEVIECHTNFIKVFESKFTEKVTQQMNCNSELVNQLETELVELKNENDANAALSEISPLFKTTQKLNSMFIEKLHKYWEYRQNCIKTSFDSIKSFAQPLISSYCKFSDEINLIKEKEEKMTNELKEKSNQTLDDLEDKLQKKEDEISILVSEKEINNRVDECREILDQIENEYHQIYTNLSDLYDKFPEEIKSVFDISEEEIVQLLKLKKTDLNLPQNAESRPHSSGSKGSNRRGPSKRKSGTPVNKMRPIVIDGTKYEEEEPIVIIPTFDDFIDELVQAPQKAKGKPPAKKIPRFKSNPKNIKQSPSIRGKIPNDDYEDQEVADFSLVDLIPKINEVIATFVYTPVPEELADWPQKLREEVLKSLYANLADSLKWATDQEKRDKLTDELNERMRVHMPRMSSIKLNVAEARKSQIQNRQIQLESFFRRQTSRFNSKLQLLQNSLDKLCEKMTLKCESMRNFTFELKQAKSTSAFSVLSQNKQVAENNLSVTFDQFVEKQKKEIGEFFDFFKTSNDRFKENVMLADSSYSEEEREVASQYFQRMDDQIMIIHDDLDAKVKSNTEKVNSLRDQISSEFENALPHNLADVQLIEMIVSLHKEYSSKFESLIFSNYTMERNLQLAMETVKSLTSKIKANPYTDHQATIDDLFASLEDLRVKLVDRGIFLKQFKSKIPSEPLKYLITLESGSEKVQLFDNEEDDSGIQSGKLSNQKKNARPLSKGNDRKSGKSKSSSSNKTIKKASKSKAKAVSVVLPVEKSSANPLTFEGRIEQLRQDLLNGLLEKASNYYMSLKTRSYPITRPDQIPATQQELVNVMSDNWEKITEKVPSVTSQSVSEYKLNVVVSIDIFKTAEKAVFDVFTDFFINEANSGSEKVKTAFDNELFLLKQKKTENQSKLNPKFADANNFDEFNKLYLDEEERNRREKSKIQCFTRNIIECEKVTMNHFLTNLPLLVKNLLLMLDRVPLIEDLKEGTVEKVERKSMRQLLKEKKFSSNSSSNRPFSQREWPVLNSIMKPLSDFIVSASPSLAQIDQQANSNASFQSANESAKSKKKPAKKVNNNNLINKNDKNAGGKVDANNNDVIVNSSLDTLLHRAAIVERNKSYSNFEEKMKRRIDEMKSFVDGLNKENEDFEKSWMEKVKELYPDYKPERIEKEERPSSSMK